MTLVQNTIKERKRRIKMALVEQGFLRMFIGVVVGLCALGFMIAAVFYKGKGGDKKTTENRQIYALMATIAFIAAVLLLPMGFYALAKGNADTSLPEGTILVQTAFSAPDYIHIIVGEDANDSKGVTKTRYVMLRRSEVNNFPAEPILAGTFKVTVKDLVGASGQKWRTYTFVPR